MQHRRQPPVLPSDSPGQFGLIAGQLGHVELARPKEGSWTRIIVEKPFGHDLESARALNQELAAVFEEKQIYRIDHYLGKETVQNLLVFRFANSIFEPLWNRQYIDHIQITNAETIGVEGRGAHYEKSGRAARHDSEPCVSSNFVDCDGAARFAVGQRRARRKN